MRVAKNLSVNRFYFLNELEAILMVISMDCQQKSCEFGYCLKFS